MDDAQRIISQAPIFVATTATLLSQPFIFELRHFALAVVDEASQILEPSIIGILASDAVGRFVLIGDHKQLPAVVQQEPEMSVTDNALLHDIGISDCRQSLFERLLRWEHRQGRTQFIGTLQRHGRMHPDVALFPLQHFYQRENLRAVPLPHQQEQSLGYGVVPHDDLDRRLCSERLLFVPNEGSEETEAQIVSDLLARIYRYTADTFIPTKTMGVIVPYRKQIALIQREMEKISCLKDNAMDISIDTVERYQGSQRDVIIYSFAVTNRYQLDFLTASTFTDDDGNTIDRKLNVALTRARRQMIVVGRPDILRQVPLFRQLIDR